MTTLEITQILTSELRDFTNHTWSEQTLKTLKDRVARVIVAETGFSPDIVYSRIDSAITLRDGGLDIDVAKLTSATHLS